MPLIQEMGTLCNGRGEYRTAREVYQAKTATSGFFSGFVGFQLKTTP
jgi:hypothetical protein